jgi:hypothetical protein
MTKRYSGLSDLQKPYLRISQDPSGQSGFKSKVIAGLGANAIKNIAYKADIMLTTGLFGIYNFDKKIEYSQRMQQWLEMATQGCVIMCHPASGKADTSDYSDDISPSRQWEFDYLSSDAFADDLAQAQISLLPMKSPKTA